MGNNGALGRPSVNRLEHTTAYDLEGSRGERVTTDQVPGSQ
jgi:hypothetical protein